jgi:hypothetical protein
MRTRKENRVWFYIEFHADVDLKNRSAHGARNRFYLKFPFYNSI